MRILVTTKGTAFVHDLEDLQLPHHAMATQSTTMKNRLVSTSIDDNCQTNHHRNTTHSIIPKNRILNTNYSAVFNKATSRNNSKNTKKYFDTAYIDTERNNFSDEELKQVHQRKLKISKWAIPKPFNKQYETNYHQTKSIILTSENFLTNVDNKTRNSEQDQINKLYSFKEIIPNTKINRIKMNMVKDSNMRAKLSKIDEQQFRTKYQDQTNLEKLEDWLNCPKVSSNKLSWIKYMNEKENINPVLIKSLVESEPIRISKVNKMCQILFHEQEHHKLLEDIIKKKIKAKISKDKVDFQSKIKQMKNDVKIFKERIDHYNHRLDDRERYRDLHKDVVLHHWNKFNLERFNKKHKVNKGTLSDGNITNNEGGL